MNNKPSFALLVDWIEGRLSPAEAETLAAQVAGDEILQADIDWIRSFHQIREETAWEAPPAGVRAQLSRRFAAYAAENKAPGLLQRLTAALTFDSRLQPAGVGLRAGSTATERQLIYSTTFADVALTIHAPTNAKYCSLFGQILPITGEMETNHSIQLLQSGHEEAFAVVTEMGEFVFEEIEAGDYELAISTDQYEIVIPLRLAV